MTIPSVGPAVSMAAADARQQLLEIASFFLEVPAETLTISEGIISIEGRQERCPPIVYIWRR